MSNRSSSSEAPCVVVERLSSSIASAEGLHRLGLDLAGANHSEQAIKAFQSALELKPRFVQARLNLGVALAQAKRPGEAIAAFKLAVRQAPRYFDGYLNLGKSLAEQGRHHEAADAFRQALRLQPDAADALNGYGLALVHLKQPIRAVVVLRQATCIDMRFAGAWSNLGFAYSCAGKYGEAEKAFKEALRLSPALPEAHVNRGNAFKEQGRLAEAIACYDLALMLNKQAGSAQWNRSLALLQSGDFERGWREYECRHDRQQVHGSRAFGGVTWDGSNPAGRTVLVYGEQGLGDVVMFCRYARLLKQAGARVLFYAPTPLVVLLQRFSAIDSVIPEGTALPPYDVHVAVMSLPHLFGTRLNTIPGEAYLQAEPASVARCRERLRVMPGLKVGVVWQGNPNHQWDRHRSIPLKSLTDLATVPGVTLISLQRGPGVEQLTNATFPVRRILTDSVDESHAVAELAAWIASVDLLITIDTMPAHLAGAMGVPVWVLLSTMVDWRWMSERPDSPWYPSMKLYRQRQRDDWSPVVKAVATDLQAIVATGSTVSAGGAS